MDRKKIKYLLLLAFQPPQDAIATNDKLQATELSLQCLELAAQIVRERFGETSKVPIADDAFQLTDKYLGRVCIVRKGRYLAGYGNLAEGQDAVKLATLLASRLP